MSRPGKPGEALTSPEFILKLRRLRRLLLPLLSGSRAKRKAKVNALIRRGYPSIANAVGEAIRRDVTDSASPPPRMARCDSAPIVEPSAFADDLGGIAAWMRRHPVRYAHLIEQVEAEYLKALGVSLPESLR